jgi:hypothetical protein
MWVKKLALQLYVQIFFWGFFWLGVEGLVGWMWATLLGIFGCVKCLFLADCGDWD